MKKLLSLFIILSCLWGGSTWGLTLTVQPSTKDTTLSQLNPTTNYNGNTNIWQISYATNKNARGIYNFDFSSIPAGAVISSAVFYAYYYGYGGSDPVGRTLVANRVTQTGWVEAQATWNIYKNSNNWSTAGGDYTDTNAVSAVVPASYGWMSWNITSMIGDVYPSATSIDILVKDSAEDSVTQYGTYTYSNHYTADTTLCPKLVITYTIPTPGGLFFLHGEAETENLLTRKE